MKFNNKFITVKDRFKYINLIKRNLLQYNLNKYWVQNIFLINLHKQKINILNKNFKKKGINKFKKLLKIKEFIRFYIELKNLYKSNKLPRTRIELVT